MDLSSVPLLSKDQEQYLFLKMNYLRFRASELQQRLARARNKEQIVEEMEHLLAEADSTRDQIVQSNLRLVVSIAKKYVNTQNTFEELLSEGNMSLIVAADKFDISRGNRFSTYATRAIRNNLYHFVLDKYRRRRLVTLVEDNLLLDTEDGRADERLCERQLERVRDCVWQMLESLDPQKRSIIASRFGLDEREESQTLKEIAGEIGISRERVRQIQSRALRELRQHPACARFDFSEWEL